MLIIRKIHIFLDALFNCRGSWIRRLLQQPCLYPCSLASLQAGFINSLEKVLMLLYGSRTTFPLSWQYRVSEAEASLVGAVPSAFSTRIHAVTWDDLWSYPSLRFNHSRKHPQEPCLVLWTRDCKGNIADYVSNDVGFLLSTCFEAQWLPRDTVFFGWPVGHFQGVWFDSVLQERWDRFGPDGLPRTNISPRV